MATLHANPNPDSSQSRAHPGRNVNPNRMLLLTSRNTIHVYSLFGPNHSPSGLANRYWSHVCRCEKPTSHADTFLVTNLKFRKRLNAALYKAGKEDTSFGEWWGAVPDKVLEETPLDYKKYREWKGVMEERVEWMEGEPLLRSSGDVGGK